MPNKISYIETQSSSLIKSFYMRNYWKVLLVILMKYILSLGVFYIVVASFIKSLSKIQPLLSIIDVFKSTGTIPPEFIQGFFSYKHLLNVFIFKSILLLAASFVAYVLILSFCASLSIKHIKNETWNITIFSRILLSYILVSLIFFGTLLFVVLKIEDLVLVIVWFYILLILYLYALAIFQISAEEKYGYGHNLKKGFHNLLKFHWTLPMMIIVILMMVVFLIFTIGSMYLIKLLSLPLILLGLLTYEAWAINYFYTLYKQKKFIG